jgi:hypothetical protein
MAVRSKTTGALRFHSRFEQDFDFHFRRRQQIKRFALINLIPCLALSACPAAALALSPTLLEFRGGQL